jgi:hypothetical protein
VINDHSPANFFRLPGIRLIVMVVVWYSRTPDPGWRGCTGLPGVGRSVFDHDADPFG